MVLNEHMNTTTNPGSFASSIDALVSLELDPTLPDHEAGRRDAAIDLTTALHYDNCDPESWKQESRAYRNGYNERWNEG